MAATASYTINYVVQGTLGAPAVDVEIYIKANSDTNYTLAFTEVNATVGNTYTYTFNNLPSHTVHQVYLQSQCGAGTIQFGDIQYLCNQVCQPLTITANGLTLDVSWDSYTPINGDSVLEYKIEYREIGSLGPYNTVIIPIQDVLDYWTNNAGTYPNYIQQITAGIFPGEQYEVRLTTVIQYNYTLTPLNTTILTQTIVGPCTATSPLLARIEQLENDNLGIQENDNFSILEQ